MRDSIVTVVGPLVFGVVGFSVWYASMFVDNNFADQLRRGSRKGWFCGVPTYLLCLDGPVWNRDVGRGDGRSRMAPVLYGSFDDVSHGASCQRVPAH